MSASPNEMITAHEQPNPLFTVFTPTYNRAHTLSRVYESLIKQTYRNFEWLIIDDGSTDKTSELVEKWATEGSVTIRYFWQENGGKHRAFNRAVELARGQLFLPADSDDDFVAIALERFLYHWYSIPDEKRHQFTGVTVRCMAQDGQLIGKELPESPMDSDSLAMLYIHKAEGEMWGFHRRDVLVQYPFPEPKGIKYVPEGIVWHRIARFYKTRFVNEALRVYRFDAGNQLIKKYQSAREYAFVRAFYLETINTEMDFFWHAPGRFLKLASGFIQLSVFGGDGVWNQYGKLKGFAQKVLWVVALPVGLMLVLRSIVQERLAQS